VHTLLSEVEKKVGELKKDEEIMKEFY